MASQFLYGAAAVSAVVCGLHVFLGGPTSARPLLRARYLHPVAKYTNYYCWHIVTLVLVAMPVSFAWAARWPEAIELAVLMTALAAAFTVWSGALVVWKQQKPLHLPQWALFLPVTVLGLFGLWR